MMSSSHLTLKLTHLPSCFPNIGEEMPGYFHQTGLMLRVSPGRVCEQEAFLNGLGATAPAEVGLFLLGNSKPWTPSAVTLNFS